MFTPINTPTTTSPARVDPAIKQPQTQPFLPPRPRTFYLLSRFEFPANLQQSPPKPIATRTLYTSKLRAHTALAADSDGKVALRMPVPGLREQEKCWYAMPTCSEHGWLFWMVQDVPLVDEGGEEGYGGRYDEGFEDGYGEGYEEGCDEGYEVGFDEGYEAEYEAWYEAGYRDVWGDEGEGEIACRNAGEVEGHAADGQGGADDGDGEWETCDDGEGAVTADEA